MFQCTYIPDGGAAQQVQPLASNKVMVSLAFEPLPLRLRHAFGTSHSSTTSRENALFTCTIASTMDIGAACQDCEGRSVPTRSVVGYGESGLPPKKAMCYLADVSDCNALFSLFRDACVADALRQPACSLAAAVAYGDPFSDALHGQGWFPTLEAVAGTGTDATIAYAIFRRWLGVLDAVAVRPEHRAAKSGVEAAIFDCWCKWLGTTFQQFVLCGSRQQRSSPPTRSFYTAALNPDVSEMIASAEFGLQYTPALKIKLDGDVQRGMSILQSFGHKHLGKYWSIDANAAWSPDVADAYAAALASTAFVTTAASSSSSVAAAQQPSLYMVEQPFGVDYVPRQNPDVDARWKRFRCAMNALGVYLYGDESIATDRDVLLFDGIVDGVNIKLEKAGGIRAALTAVLEARRLGLRVWIGTMVSSPLGCAQAAQVAVLAGDDSDVDGGLLVHCERFSGGFEWRPSDGAILLAGAALDGVSQNSICIPPEHCGFGVVMTKAHS